MDVLPALPAESVHCVVTSPPYWGLRDYGTAEWEGGDLECDHRSPTMREGRNENRPKLAGSEATNQAQLLLAHRTGCGKCGAVKVDRQLGLEATPEEYVERMVAVFREVRRVLREDGTVWLNLGDSYAGNRSYQVPDSKHRDVGNSRGMTVSRRRDDALIPRTDLSVPGPKPKDLVGIPWRVAFALQADGWWLRSAIVWAKPNPMPESVRDRPTSSYEMLFLLAKSERYYYDADAIREPDVAGHKSGNGYARVDTKNIGYRLSYGGRGQEEQWLPGAGRNKRNVWTIATKPFPEAHFATFPEDLVTPCVLAGTSEHGCCAECRAPWAQEVELGGSTRKNGDGPATDSRFFPSGGAYHGRLGERERRSVGWAQSCSCTAATKPCTVLDPFAGAGTVGVVCSKLGRDFVGIELSPEYAAMARRRISASPLSLFAAGT
ncbi:MAG: site-specific DNA-methyltransferase [Chloroflexi bacterium]|nr:site-specific DNA-methyltransferase [Chloroflexota bacterium]